jgi:hypothetical protein
VLRQNYISDSSIRVIAKHRLRLPDDGLCEPKHVGATFIILIVLII